MDSQVGADRAPIISAGCLKILSYHVKYVRLKIISYHGEYGLPSPGGLYVVSIFSLEKGRRSKSQGPTMRVVFKNCCTRVPGQQWQCVCGSPPHKCLLCGFESPVPCYMRSHVMGPTRLVRSSCLSPALRQQCSQVRRVSTPLPQTEGRIPLHYQNE